MIKLTNTVTGKKEVFKTITPNHVKLYVCGITPYDFAHLGHGRVYVTFDVLYRLLIFMGYEIVYCRNFTDIDDKIIARAKKELADPKEFLKISNKYIQAFHEDMARLNCQTPQKQPRVTENIIQIIKFVEGLIVENKAYVVDNDVYFHIGSFPAYGKLSKRKIEDLRIGARVEVNERKKDPLDFALWKGTHSDEPGWQSPWGYGRPGWHIECSAFVLNDLGKTIDIHAGGMDLIFPHHENEIAQSESLNHCTFANFWLHNAFVQINKEKMSKSLGNFFTLRDVFEKFDPMIVRYFILNHYYRAPIEFSFEDIEALKKSYQKIVKIFEGIDTTSVTDTDIKKSKIVQRMLDFLCDDLNTPGMLGVFFEHVAELQTNQQEGKAVKAFMERVLGLTLMSLAQAVVEITPEIQHLMHEREAARAAKNWQRSDELREQLRALGVDVQDKKK